MNMVLRIGCDYEVEAMMINQRSQVAHFQILAFAIQCPGGDRICSPLMIMTKGCPRIICMVAHSAFRCSRIVSAIVYVMALFRLMCGCAWALRIRSCGYDDYMLAIALRIGGFDESNANRKLLCLSNFKNKTQGEHGTHARITPQINDPVLGADISLQHSLMAKLRLGRSGPR